MDKVRFGRALGQGARQAAKSLLEAADAAGSPDPAATPSGRRAVQRVTSPPATELRAASTRPAPPSDAVPASGAPGSDDRTFNRSGGRASTVGVAARAGRYSKSATKQARQSFLGPLARFSSVVSLQVSGTFFAVLALVMGQAAWRGRAALHSPGASTEARHLCLVGSACLLFTYFALSNFLRARRRDQQ